LSILIVIGEEYKLWSCCVSCSAISLLATE
jgi:hypothetical protein